MADNTDDAIPAESFVHAVMAETQRDVAERTKLAMMREKLKEEGLENIKVYQSLGRYNYFGVLNICGRIGKGVCVGNSSSGIKETPALGCPVVNIGSRQDGRLRADNVIDVDYNSDRIFQSVKIALYDEEFRKQSRSD